MLSFETLKTMDLGLIYKKGPCITAQKLSNMLITLTGESSNSDYMPVHNL